MTHTTQISEKDKARFASKIDKNGPLPNQENPHYAGLQQCWQWHGTICNGGHGQTFLNKKTMGAHRASYLIHRGPIPHTMLVMHICDNRQCVNPDHLALGTPKDNMADCRAKGRMHRSKGPRAPYGPRKKRLAPEPLPEGKTRAQIRKEKIAALLEKTYAKRRQA